MQRDAAAEANDSPLVGEACRLIFVYKKHSASWLSGITLLRHPWEVEIATADCIYYIQHILAAQHQVYAALQINAGLQYLHRRRIIHRDIASRNCLYVHTCYLFHLATISATYVKFSVYFALKKLNLVHVLACTFSTTSTVVYATCVYSVCVLCHSVLSFILLIFARCFERGGL